MSYLKYFKNEDNSFHIDKNMFVTILGKGNKKIIDDLLFVNKNNYITIDYLKINNTLELSKYVGFVLNKHMDIFLGETVRDEISYGMESLALSNEKMMKKISDYSYKFKIGEVLDRDPYSLGTSDKVKLKIVSSLVCNPKILILDNVLEELDNDDLELVIKLLKEEIKQGLTIINFTNNIEETLYGDRIIINNEEKLLIEGPTLNVLNEEKLLKRLGLGQPFIIDFNSMLMDYNITNKYILDYEKLVNEIWK